MGDLDYGVTPIADAQYRQTSSRWASVNRVA